MGVVVREVEGHLADSAIGEWGRVMNEAMTISGTKGDIFVSWWFETSPTAGQFWLIGPRGVACEATYDNAVITLSLMTFVANPEPGLQHINDLTADINKPDSLQKIGIFLGEFANLQR
jgi:hypothetical protein